MAIYYSIVSGPDGAVLTVSGDVSASITAETPTFEEAVSYLSSNDPESVDPEVVRTLVDPKAVAETYIKRVSDRIAFSGNTLLFDGDPVNNSLANTIIRLSTEDESADPAKLIKFLENLMNNPSEHSRDQLYDWIAPRNITITNDGHFLAYKGLLEDFRSIHSGPGIVNNVEYRDTHLDNSPGNIVEFSRSKVEANSSVGCSVGLHVGTHSYASSFAQGKLVLVKVNPRDVVSVPTDCDAQKMRVCRYEVLEEVQAEVKDVCWYEDDEYSDDDDSYDPEDYEDEYDDYEDLDDDYDDLDDDQDSDDQYKYIRKFFS